MSDGVQGWLLIGGSIQLRYSDSFRVSFAANGYQKLPSGLIIQWTSMACDNNGDATWIFPVTFPNSVRSVTATAISGGTYYGMSVTYATTAISAIFKASAAAPTEFYAMAIGY
jgi:hypothetical protein